MKTLNALSSALLLANASIGAHAQTPEDTPPLTLAGDISILTIIGSRESARELSGSGYVIEEQQLEVESITDINQVLKTVPGVYVREEEGQGLRPNIGIRGATAERSSKITIMEDGVLMAPAPYSNPAAYYFPEVARMSSVEVLKGAPLLRYGPQTTGGVVNLVSTPIPEHFSGFFKGSAGAHNTRDIQARLGGRQGQFGWLVETVQRDSDGFKDIDRSSRDTGHDIKDYMAKLGWEGENQSLHFKAQYSDEVSNSTYLGLTDADFKADPDRRYGMSELDTMSAEHQGYSLTYQRDLSDNIQLTALGYFNDFKRNWFKLNNGKQFIDAANAGDANAQAILEGTVDVEGLVLRNNNRAYESYGLDLNLAIELGNHNLEIGGRHHQDEMDRFQPDEIFDQIDGKLVFREIVEPRGGNNRFEEGEALSLWITDSWQATDRLKLNLALRYEDVETSRDQFADPQRTQLDGQRRNESDELLPGASFTYNLTPEWQVLSGYHRGFSTLGGGAKKFEDPETSDNFEAGVRFNKAGYFAEVIGFYSDFDNKSENCSVGSPCSNGSTSGSFTLGEAVIAGVEVQLSKAFQFKQLTLPFDLTYTYTEAEIDGDNPITGFNDGDQLADVPENIFSIRTGVETHWGWDNYITAKYIDELCDTAGCNKTSTPLDETESLFVVDYNSRYTLPNYNLTVFVKVENIFDSQSIVSRLPDGARPNKPITAVAGVEYRF